MLDAGCWMLDTGYWILDTGYWYIDTKVKDFLPQQFLFISGEEGYEFHSQIPMNPSCSCTGLFYGEAAANRT
jgi:hypothetical protein